MKFTDRELEVIGHGLLTLYGQVKEMYEEGSDDGTDTFVHYLSEIKDLQTRITNNIPNEKLNWKELMCQIDIDPSTVRSYADDILGEDNVLDNSEVEKIIDAVQSDFDCACIEPFLEKHINIQLESRNHREY